VTGDWRGLRDCIVRSVLVCTIRKTRQMDGACGTNEGEEWCIYMVLVGKPEGKISF